MADFKKGKGTAQGVCYAGHGILLQYPFGPVVIIAPNAAALQAMFENISTQTLDAAKLKELMIFEVDAVHSVH